MLLGYNKALSPEIVAIEECPILLPEIVAALDRHTRACRADLRHAAAFPHRRHRDRFGPRRRRQRERQAVRGGAPRRLAFRDGPGFCAAVAGRRDHRRAEKAGGDVRRHRRSPFRRAASCRRPKRPSRRWPSWSARIWRAPRRSPTCFPAAAPSRCGWRASRKCMRSKATRQHLRHSTGRIVMPTGLKRVTGERRDLFRRPLTFKELGRVRRAGLRPAARRRRGSGQADRPLRRSARRRGLVQSGDAGARPAHPRRRRLHGDIA